MPLHTITFNFPISSLNISLQVGDTIYHVPTTNPTAFNTFDIGNLSNVQVFGVLTVITDLTPLNGFTLTIDSNITTPVSASYIMFAKEKKVNTTSLLGYYADIQFVNNSKEKAELFSVGSEVTESSK